MFAFIHFIIISLINNMNLRYHVKSEPLGQWRQCWTTATRELTIPV